MAIALANDDVTNSIPRRVNGTDFTTTTCDVGGPSNNGIYTPAANSLLVLIFGLAGSTDPTVGTVSGHGVTYSAIEALTTANLGRLFIYAANAGASPTSTAATATWGTTQNGIAMYDLEFTGVDLTSGVAAAFVQKPTDSTGSGTALQVILAAAGDALNRPLACCFVAANEAITEDASYAEIHDQGHGAPNRRLSASFQAGGFDTTVDHSWTTVTQGRSIVVELKATGGGGGSVPVLDSFGMTGFFGS